MNCFRSTLRVLCCCAFASPAAAAPTVTTLDPAPGSTVSSITSVNVTFSEPVTAVNASDLSVNGEPIVSVTGSGAGPYVFSFPQPPPGTITLGWDTDQSIAGIGTGAFVTPGDWSYTLTDTIAPALGKIRTTVAGQEMDDVLPAPGSTAGVLTGAVVTFSEPVAGVTAGDLLVNGTAATVVTGDNAGPYVFTFTQPVEGAVNFTWAGGHGIADSAANAFGGAGWSITRAASAGTVQISEFLAANAGTAVMAGSDTDGTRDENWDLSSWIELYNPGASPVNLLGWSLTDDATRPAQWVFPARPLAAGARLLVFASSKDRKPVSGNLHTNFGLSANGGTLALFPPDAPATTAASSWVNYPPQRYDYSYGAQSTDDAARYFSPPTVSQGAYTVPTSDGVAGTLPPAPAGAVNGTSTLIGLTPEPTASVGRGFFNEAFVVVLSCQEPGAVIRYTLDGSPPLVSSTPYSTLLNITGTTVLRVAAFGENLVPSRAVTHTYLFPDQVVHQPGPPYDNPASATDNANPQPPAPGGSPLPIAWGFNSTFTAAQTLPGFPTGTATGSNNLSAGQIPADYGMDPKVWADPTRYNDAGAVDAVNGKTNLERIKSALRTLPALSLVIKSTDFFGTYPNGQAGAAANGNPAAPLYPNSSAGVKTDMTKACSLEMMQPDGKTVFVVDCGIDLHGNASRDPFKNPKHGFTVRFKDKYGAGNLEADLYPDSPVKKWDKLVLRGDFGGSWLHQSGADGSPVSNDSSQRPRGIRIREAFCKNSFRDMGRVASHHRFVNLFINGVCWGSYELMEDEAEDFSSSYLGGDKHLHDVIDQKNDAVLNNRSASLKSGTWTVWSAMKTLLGWTGGSATQDRNVPPTAAVLVLAWTNAQYETLKTWLDLPWFHDYMIWQTFGGHRDWANDNSDAARYMKNVYFIRPPGGTFKAMPWDMENILWHENEDRITGGTTLFNPSGPITAPSLAPPVLIHPRIKSNAEYRLEFGDRAWRHMVRPGGALTPAENLARLDKWAAVVGADAICLESARWGDYRYKVHAYSGGTTTQVYSWNGAWYDNNAAAQYNGAWSAGLMKFNTGRTLASQLGTYSGVGMSNAWLDEIRRLRTIYFPARTRNVLWQYRFNDLYPYANAPEVRDHTTNTVIGDTTVPSGSLVKLTLPADTGTISAGDIYYTLNGSDPRPQYDTAIVPRAGALLYSAPFPITGPTIIRARARGTNTGVQTLVRAASTASVVATYASTGGTASRGQFTAAPLTLDSIPLAAGDRILLKNQTSSNQNGVWSVTTPGTGGTGVWDRATDWDADGEVHMGMLVRATAGTANTNTIWRVSTIGGIIVGGSSGTSVAFGSSTPATQWSALMEITLTAGPPRPTVVISEINYNPRSSQGGTAAEFVEFHNYGTLPVEMTSWSMDGISFIFPGSFFLQPGQRIVIANNENPVTFAAQYPGVVVLGYYGGTLDNGGERLSLLDLNDRVVCSAEYDDDAPWPAGADNGGYSLELINPAGDPQSAANWHASTALKGSPGAVNSTPAAGALVISEIFAAGGRGLIHATQAQPDFVEVHNPTAGIISGSGWTLNGMALPAFNFLPGQRYTMYPPAPLDAAQGEFTLRNPAGQAVDGVRYGPQDRYLGFSRTGTTWAARLPSPGDPPLPNFTGPVQSVRINEIMANPVPGEPDWIEFWNIDPNDDDVDLTGMTLVVNGEAVRVTALTAVPNNGGVRLYCDPGSTRGDALNISLPAAGATVELRGPNWEAGGIRTYGLQQEGLTEGILHGTSTWTALEFPSPGSPNMLLPALRPLLNEVLLINRDGDNAPWARRPAWIEIKNPTAAAVTVRGWNLRTKSATPQTWTFPDGVIIPAGGLLSVWSDPRQPASTAATSHLNAALAINASYTHWGLELVTGEGLVYDSITWGLQIPNLSIGRLPDNSWNLLSAPTRGTANTAAATLTPAGGTKINEWLGGEAGQLPVAGFIELFNPAALPAAPGLLWLGDEPSESGRRKWQVPALTYIAGQKHALFTTGNGTAQPTRFLFDVSGDGEYLRLSENDAATTAVDAVSFGRFAALDKSLGRLPDGTSTIGSLTPTPGTPNTSAPGPVMVIQPASAAVPAGQSHTLLAFARTTVTGQWFRDGQPLAGRTENGLTIASVTATDEGDYTYAATDASGTTVSQSAHLTVLYTYAAWAAQYGVGTQSADNDSDGLTNGDEFLGGTNPLAATPLSSGVTGGGESIAGNNYLTLEVTVSRRAAYSSLTGQRSGNLSLWNDAAPAITETVSTQPNGDQRVKVKFPWLPGDDREFVRLKLTP